ncbi:MAG: NAD(P)/FAD-dependent oxidoreductase [Myxococcota bacterium]
MDQRSLVHDAPAAVADPRPHVLIIGGGFGGLAAAQGLRRAPVRITVVDKSNHHLFQPLLYQVATASLAPSDIAEPIRSILRRQDNAAVRLAEVTEIDLAGKRAHLIEEDGDREWIHWDKLVVAAGASHGYFGHDDWSEHAPGLKTLGDALEIRRKILYAFERAEWTTDPALRTALTTFVVIGGGPTGVELAGSLAEIAFWTLRRDFRNIMTTRARVVLVEAGHGLLNGYPPDLQEKAKSQLEKIGVEVRFGAAVTGVDAHGIVLGADRIDAGTVLWAAGVRGAGVAKSLGVTLDKAGRVPVQPDCSIPGHPDAFVIGDLALFVPEPGGKPLPGVAQVAMQGGAHVATTIAHDLERSPRTPFVYNDKGSMATIGRSKAVADLGWMKASGFVAWFLWAFVHVLFLVTFRSRLLVMTKWAWAWFTYERAVRLIWTLPEEQRAISRRRPESAA